MQPLGKILVILGVLLTLVGLLFWFAGPAFRWFGRLPGDIRVEKPGFSFFFPWVSLLLLSIGITLLARLIGWLIKP